VRGGPPHEDAGRLERALGRVLLWGVRISAFLLAVGLALGVGIDPSSPLSNALLNAGLIVLICTPVVRVLVSFVEYLREGDWLFVFTSLAVLAILTASLLAAFVAA
jgi:uncharacterized membrane protein